MSLCHFLSFIKLFMSVSSLQAKKVLTYEQFASPTTARSHVLQVTAAAFKCPLRSFINTWDSNEFDKSRQTLSCVLSLVAHGGLTAALDQWAHMRAGTSDCSGRLVDVDWSSCRCAELGENTLNLSLALSYASFIKSYATEYRFKRLSSGPKTWMTFYKLESVKNKAKDS